MSWKRISVSVPVGLLIMISDGLLLILVTRLYLPGHPPIWLAGAIFYFDAWPLTLTQHVFPHAGRGPSFLAVASAALVDLIILSGIIYALLSWRAHKKLRA